MTDAPILQSLELATEDAFRTLDRALESDQLQDFEWAQFVYEGLQRFSYSEASKLGMQFTGFLAAIPQERARVLGLVMKAKYEAGVADGYALKLTGKANPDSQTDPNSLKVHLTPTNTGVLISANVQNLYRLGRLHGYAGNSNEVRQTIAELASMPR